MSNSDTSQLVIEHCPFPFVAISSQNTIVSANPSFALLTDMSADELIGKGPEDSTALSILLGEKSVINVSSENNSRLFSRSSSQADSGDGPLVFHYFYPAANDEQLLSENKVLKEQVEKLTLTDDLTGLANERALSQQLAIQVTRSRRYHNPLTLAIIDISIDSGDISHILDQQYDETIVAFSHFMRERLRWADFIARCQAGRFVIILPETGEKEAIRLFQDIVSEKSSIDLPDEQKQNLSIHFGLAEWEKGNDPRMLVERASAALKQAC